MADRETYKPPETSIEQVLDFLWYRLFTLWPVKWVLSTVVFVAVAATYWWGDWQTWSWEVFSTMLLASTGIAGALSIWPMFQVEGEIEKIDNAGREKTPPEYFFHYSPRINLKKHATYTTMCIVDVTFAILLLYKLFFVAIPWAWRGFWNLWSAVPIESLKDLSTPQWVCIAGVALALLVALAWWRNHEPRAKDETRPIRV